MTKLFAALKKEFLILIRDIPGLVILFIMPLLLIIVVTLAQQNALKSSKETKTGILFLDQSGSEFSRTLVRNLDSSGLFQPIRAMNGIPFDRTSVETIISGGDYPASVIIGPLDSTIEILFDPALQPAFKQSLSASLTYLIKGTQSRIAVETLLKVMAPGMDSVISQMMQLSIEGMTPVKEIYSSGGKTEIQPSIIQNNVPGFILFAMFFIVITLSGSLINDKNEGAFFRIKTLPVRPLTILSGKVILYTMVCLLQFILMMIAGAWLLPSFFGLPALQAGNHPMLIALTTIASALAAVGFGLLVGAVARTHGQAALFGAVTVVILGVISGTFLPVNLMPGFLQFLSLISPIRWGIDNYLDLFIRNSDFLTILPNLILLFLFFILSLIISIAIFAKRF